MDMIICLGDFYGDFGIGFAPRQHCTEWPRAYLIEVRASNNSRFAIQLLDHRAG